MEVVKRNEVSEMSIYVRRKRFGEMVSDDVKRLRALEAENAQINRIVAYRNLEIAIEVVKQIGAKNGEYTGALRGSVVCDVTQVQSATCMCTASSQSIEPAKCAEPVCQERADCCGDVLAFVDIFARRLALRSRFAWLKRQRDWQRTLSKIVGTSRHPSARETTSASASEQPSARTYPVGQKLGMEL